MMNFFTRVARFLFWLLIVSWSMWLLRRFVGWLFRDAATAAQQCADAASVPQTTEVARRLVRDPVCGMHIDETLAIPFRVEGELLHFCCTACRDKFAVSVQKMAANG
jgi:YHS domain-containing protein